MEYSKDLFHIHRTIFKWCGVMTQNNPRLWYSSWSFSFNLFITLLYPIHLMLGILDLETTEQFFKCLAIVFTCSTCSIKFVVFWYYMDEIRHMEELFTILDSRIQTVDEKGILKSVKKSCKMILVFFLPIYVGSAIFSELALLIEHRKRLLFPGWFPFDWTTSDIRYLSVHMYQFIGVTLQIVCNYANDTLPPVSLALLCGHVEVLGLRVTKLGTNPEKSLHENNQELKQCIQDHQHLIKLYYCMAKILSKGTFFQLFITSLNLCCTVIYCLFFANDVWSYIYYSILIFAEAIEIFPSCYYGSQFEAQFKELSTAIFSSNWIDQDREFKQNIRMFSERCFQPTTFYCMGIFRMHLDTFYVTIKGAYSLFAVIIQAK